MGASRQADESIGRLKSFMQTERFLDRHKKARLQRLLSKISRAGPKTSQEQTLLANLATPLSHNSERMTVCKAKHLPSYLPSLLFPSIINPPLTTPQARQCRFSLSPLIPFRTARSRTILPPLYFFPRISSSLPSLHRPVPCLGLCTAVR